MVQADCSDMLTPNKVEAVQLKLTQALQMHILKPWNATQVQGTQGCKSAATMYMYALLWRGHTCAGVGIVAA